MGTSRLVATAVACLVLAGACTVADPVASLPVAEPDDPAVALAGRAVEALGGGGIDVVMRIGADGFRLPEHEHLLDVHGDRVLSGRAGAPGENIRLIVRDLAGDPIREIDAGMQLPQVAIVRGDDVYFGGIDFGEGVDPYTATDRGAWVTHGDAPPEPIVAAAQGSGLLTYDTIELSPDRRTLGISRCGEDACTTILVRQGSAPVEIPKPGLIALANEVALFIGQYSDVTAYAVSDGAELWRAETDGAYYERYATTDGARIVISSIEDAGDDDGNSTDQLRIEVMDALTGAVERTVLVSTEDALVWVEASLSSARSELVSPSKPRAT
jgi:hypothetical protein